jgi:hypothetical protein
MALDEAYATKLKTLPILFAQLEKELDEPKAIDWTRIKGIVAQLIEVVGPMLLQLLIEALVLKTE